MKFKTRIIAAFRSLHGLARRMWCKHEWRTHSSNRYAVVRGDGSKEGEVTLTVLDCCKCGASTLIPSDRIHSPSDGTERRLPPPQTHESTQNTNCGSRSLQVTG